MAPLYPEGLYHHSKKLRKLRREWEEKNTMIRETWLIFVICGFCQASLFHFLKSGSWGAYGEKPEKVVLGKMLKMIFLILFHCHDFLLCHQSDLYKSNRLSFMPESVMAPE